MNTEYFSTYTTGNGGMPVAGMIPVYYIPAGATSSMSAGSPAFSQNSIHVDGGTIAPKEHPGPPSPLLMGGNTFMSQGKLSMGSNIDVTHSCWEYNKTLILLLFSCS